jgi:hypothetical protein
MIIKEEYRTRADGVVLNRTYSDEGKYIVQNETGNVYAEAIDIDGIGYTYTETEEFIEAPEDEGIPDGVGEV